ncbi:hypothetical protein ANO11243_041890 [Dothideomycetidae sp. 11243]|nr:hypothetical protein ANO11243_041890 [fungal sp. No.11243]
MVTVTVTEGKVTLDDGAEVYTKTWKAAPEQARVLFIHGFSDHCGNYEMVHPYLASRGISVHGFDQRGFGRSVKSKAERGMTGTTDRVLADITCMLRSILSDTSSSAPLFVYGHSMGGAETLTYASLDPDNLVNRIRGFVVQAPLIALAPETRPYAITKIIGRVVARVLPHHQMVNPLEPSNLSRNEEDNKRWRDDPLNHDTGTLEGLGDMLDRGEALESGQYRLAEGKNEGGKTRILLIHGTADKINEFAASKRWMEKSCDAKDKKFWQLDGWYHNMHAEPEVETFRSGIADWILERSGSVQSEA